MITDYVDIIKSLIKLAKDNKIRKNLVDNIFQQQALTRNFMTGKHFKYADLIENMVSVDLVVRVERKTIYIQYQIRHLISQALQYNS